MGDQQQLTSEPLWHGIFRLAGPAVLMMVLQGTYNYVDTYFVGYLGADALAGISTGGFVLWMTFALAQLVTVGVTAKVARRIGEQNRVEADRTAVRGILFSVFSAMVIAIPLYFLLPSLFAFMETTASVTQLGTDYMIPMIITLPTIFLSFVVNGVLSAAGDTRTPFVLMFVSLLANALLAPMMIFGWGGLPALGVAGAAWATALCRIFYTILAWFSLQRTNSVISFKTHGRLNLRFSEFWEVLRIGAPKTATGILFALVYMALTRITSHFGTPNVAALRIGHIYEGLSFFVAMGFAMAAGTLVGQNLGARQPRRAAQAAWVTSLIVGLCTALVAVLFRFGSVILSRVFSSDAQVITAASEYLLILAWSQPFMGIELVLEGCFNGAGDTLPPMAIQLPLTVMRYPIALLLSFAAGWGVEGVWWAISGTSIVKCLLLIWWFGRGRWAKTVV